MIQYGRKKRGSGKIHPHNECGVCSEIGVSKKSERHGAKIEIDREIEDWGRRKKRIIK